MSTSRWIAFVLIGLWARAAVGEPCQGFGPQAPRDIDDPAGANQVVSSFAPDYRAMNLCNIHFHKHAEHRSAAFSVPAEGRHGGFRCSLAGEPREREPLACSNVHPGDTIEVHWVYSSCEVAPGEGLGACLSQSCGNPNLRVEAQVFEVVADSAAADFERFDYRGAVAGDYHQARALPADTGPPVRYLGSTTGPSFNHIDCSPLQVSWSVRPRCSRVDLASLDRWCRDNAFGEHHAHDVRELVLDPRLLSRIE